MQATFYLTAAPAPVFWEGFPGKDYVSLVLKGETHFSSTY